ncbi:MAG: cell wall metabolism sensor histidine kinase WalK [Firmicutes bacterium]|nr:cell wall metabolism sensor histidine kinase WalK [Bacillota bacterium]
MAITSNRFFSLRWKLSLAYLFICFVPLLIFFGTITTAIENYFEADRRKTMLTTANIISGSVSRLGYFDHLADADARRYLDVDLNARSRDGGFRILVFDSGCMALSDSNGLETGKTLLVPEVITALQKKTGYSLRRPEKAVYAAAAVENGDAQIVGAVLLVSSVDDIFTSVSDIQQKLILYAALAAMVMIVLVLGASSLLIAPLKNILKVVQRVAEGHFSQRVTVKGHDEYAKMGRAFNEMTEKLEKSEKSREDFVANVSHELRTPLSSIKVLSESILLQEAVPVDMYREFLRDITSEVDRMTYIVSDLLNLVKLDRQDTTLNIAKTDLNRMLESVLKRLSPLAEEKHIDLILESNREVTIDADEVKLSLAITNLVENGVKYTPPEGTVRVAVDADHQDAYITVSDTGIGISEDELPKIFDRFYRVDKTRDRETGGTGLGLAITRAAVLLHNGGIRVVSKENEGSIFTVRVPIRR